MMSIKTSTNDICLVFPLATFKIVQLRHPQMIPWVMEWVSGMTIIAMKKGMASSNLSHRTYINGFNMNTPARTSMGAVDKDGTRDRSGDRNMNGIKSKPVTTDVSPVRPPSRMPVEDSTYAVVGLVPITADSVTPMAFTLRHFTRLRGSPSSSTRSPASHTPTQVEKLSKMQEKSMTKITGHREKLAAPITSRCNNRLKSGAAYHPCQLTTVPWT